MTTLAKITNEFEGATITTITYKGKLCWIASEVGQTLGYSKKGGRLVDKITESWSTEMLDGSDYAVLHGEELSDFKTFLELTPESGVSRRSPHIMLLYETGLHFVCLKTNKQIGRRLRRFLADEVMPQLVRDDRYSPDREVVDDEVVGKNVMDDIRLKSPAQLREERLSRQQKANALKELAKLLRRSQRVTPEVAECYEIEAFEALSDEDFTDLKPSNRGFWKGVSEIAHDLDETIWAIGKAALNLGLRGNFPGIAREIELSEIKDGKPVKAYLYSPKAVKMIRRSIGKTRRPSCREADYDLP